MLRFVQIVIARSEVTKQASREDIASGRALAMTIGLRGKFCAEDVQRFDDGRCREEFWSIGHQSRCDLTA